MEKVEYKYIGTAKVPVKPRSLPVKKPYKPVWTGENIVSWLIMTYVTIEGIWQLLVFGSHLLINLFLFALFGVLGYLILTNMF